MKARIGHWVTLGIFSAMMTASAIAYLSGNAQMVETFRHLGYPDYFRTLLGVAKLLGVVVLLAPRVPPVLREWAYAGFGITLLAATISHAVSGDAAAHILAPVASLGLLVAARMLAGARRDVPARGVRSAT